MARGGSKGVRVCVSVLVLLAGLWTGNPVEGRSQLSETLQLKDNVDRIRHETRVKRQVLITDRRQLFIEAKGYPTLDIVFALERSNMGSNSRSNFEMVQKKFLRTLIRDFLQVKPDKTRVALITFGRDVKVIYDGISDPLTKCDLIGTDFLWDQLQYIDGPTSQGANLTGVFKEAARMLGNGRSLRQARSWLIIFSTGQYTDFDERNIGHRNWYDTYAVGVDDRVDRNALSRIVNNGRTNVYGTINEWRNTMNALEERYHVLSSGQVPDWVPQYKLQGCQCPQGSACWCNALTGYTRCSCTNGYMDSSRNCIRPCDLGVCSKSPGTTCSSSVGGIHYTCECDQFSPNCDLQSIQDCPQNGCQNGGKCYDGKDQYVCQCQPGYAGVNCEINENECQDPRICPSGQTCVDQINSFTCVVSGQGTPVPPTYYPPTPRTLYPTPNPTPYPTPNPTPYQTPYPTPKPPNPTPLTPFRPNPTQRIFTNPPPRTQNTDPVQKSTTLLPAVDESEAVVKSDGFLDNLTEDQRLLLTVVPPAGLGLIFLLLGIGALIYVVRRRDGRKKNDLSGVTETTSVASHNPSLMTFDSKCYKDEGTPGPPKLPKLTKAQEADPKRVSYGEFDDMLYGNEALQRGMEEWYAYVLELYHNQGLNRVLIVRLDGEKWVLSPGSKLYMDEIEALFNLLSKKMTAATFNMQGREFGIVGNTDFVLMAHTFRNSKRAQEILCATKTRQFVIVGTSDFSSDNGRCRQKVVELKDHIKVQGL